MTNKNNIPATLRGYKVLEQVVCNDGGVFATDLAKQLSMPKATVHRIAKMLENEGLLVKESNDKRYLISKRLRNFAVSILTNSFMNSAIHHLLQNLASDIGETCNCTVLDGLNTVYLDRVEANWKIRIQLPVGSKLPLHCTASGKLFLAYMSPNERKRVLQSFPLDKKTANTITDITILEQELAKIRKNKVGHDCEEFLNGMVAIAVPVFTDKGTFNFTIAVHSPTIRKNLDDLFEYLPKLQEAAKQLAKINSI